jgi:hypothetical protein
MNKDAVMYNLINGLKYIFYFINTILWTNKQKEIQFPKRYVLFEILDGGQVHKFSNTQRNIPLLKPLKPYFVYFVERILHLSETIPMEFWALVFKHFIKGFSARILQSQHKVIKLGIYVLLYVRFSLRWMWRVGSSGL